MNINIAAPIKNVVKSLSKFSFLCSIFFADTIPQAKRNTVMVNELIR